MKEQLLKLVKLQSIEDEIEVLSKFLANTSSILKKLDDSVTKGEKEVLDEESRIAEFKKEYRTLEYDTQANKDRIKKSDNTLTFIKNDKEYQALLREIDELTTKNSSIEDNMLNYLDEIEIKEKEFEIKKEKLSESIKHINIEKATIKNNARHKEKKLSDLNKEKDEKIKELKAELLNQYNTVKKVSSRAIVSIVDGVCQGCNLNIPMQKNNELQQFKNIELCPHCQRIIYYQES
mmetsp:Transcript_23708/g.11415  ORF Transcript_23708/g.11415 Transcript_23708/m.11415 type:complete len:235 (+) Transcript_23708:572-1276(+)